MLDLKLAHVLFLDASEVQSDFLFGNQGDFDQLPSLVHFLDDSDHLFVFSQARVYFFAGVGLRQIGLHLLESLDAQMTPEFFLGLDLSDQHLSDPQNLLIDLINIRQRDLNLPRVSRLHKRADHKIPRSLVRLKGLNGSLFILLSKGDIHIINVPFLISEQVRD